MEKIRLCLEYLLVLLIILEFNTPYQYFPIVGKIIKYGTLFVLFALLMTYFRALLNKNLSYVLVYFCGAVPPFLNVAKGGYSKFILLYFMILPMLWMYLYIRGKKSRWQTLFIRYSNVVIVLAVLSVIMWLFCSILQTVQATAQIPNSWIGEWRLINTYYGIYFETQKDFFLGESIWRNSGIFNEAPMYNMILCSSLIVECFVREKLSKMNVVILSLTILTTLTTTGKFFLLILWLWMMINKIKKSKILIATIIPAFAVCSFFIVTSIIEAKMDTKGGASSVDTRSNSIKLGIEAGLNAPVLGHGLFLKKIQVGSKVLSEHSNSIFELFAYGGLYTLLLYVGSLVLIPVLYYLKFKENGFLMMMLMFFVVFAITLSHYKYLTLMFVAWGLANVEFKKVKSNMSQVYRKR